MMINQRLLLLAIGAPRLEVHAFAVGAVKNGDMSLCNKAKSDRNHTGFDTFGQAAGESSPQTDLCRDCYVMVYRQAP